MRRPDALRRLLSWNLLAAASLLVAGTTAAQTWQVGYDPDLGTLPSAQGWTHLVDDPAPDDGLDEANYMVSGGVLSQGDTGGTSSDPGNTQFYRYSPPTVDFDRDLVVVDLRLKVSVSTVTEPGSFGSPVGAGFAVRVEDTDRRVVTLYVGSLGLFLYNADDEDDSNWIPFNATTGFADLRLTVDRDQATVSVNGDEQTSLESRFFGQSVTATHRNTILIGDESTSESSSSEIEAVTISRFQPPVADVRSYAWVTDTGPSGSSTSRSLSVDCPPLTFALGGGGATIGADGSVALTDSEPIGSPPTGWRAKAREHVAAADSWQLRVDVLCGEVSGYEHVTDTQPLDSNAAYQVSEITCPQGRAPVGGGVGQVGPNLNQVLVTSSVTEDGWRASANDFGTGTSSDHWDVEAEVICSDATGWERVTGAAPTDGTSPKQAVANCPSGKVPVAGGARIVGDTDNAALRASRPKDGAPGAAPVGWWAEAEATSGSWYLEATAICAPAADPTVTKVGLVGRWRGENAGDDSWGPGHGSTENGVGYEFWELGHAFEFDGSSTQWVRIPSRVPGHPDYDLYPERSFTIDAWVVTDTLPSGSTAEIVNLVDGAGDNTGGSNPSAWGLRMEAGGELSGFFRTEQTLVTTPTVLTSPPRSYADGRPHHVALMRDSAQRKVFLYVDGRLEMTDTITLNVNEGPLSPGGMYADPAAIGAARDVGGPDLHNGVDGLVDDIRFYDRSLTAEEVENIAGCAVPIVPRVLNLDADLFAGPAGSEQGLCVFLEAGEYRLTLVEPSLHADARHTAWSPAPANPWGTVYSVQGETFSGFTTGLPVAAATAEEAFDSTTDREVTFWVDTNQRVRFSIQEDLVLDNRGGVSVLLEKVYLFTDGFESGDTSAWSASSP